MAIKTAAGTKLFIGTTAAATNLTTYQSDSFTAIGSIESFGALEDSAEEIKFTSLSDARVQKVAGVRDGGMLEVTMAYDPADTGQIALISAFNANAGLPFNFKIELNDALTTGAGPHSGTKFFVKGVVIATAYEGGSANDVVRLKARISITSGVTVGAAA